MIWLSLFTSHLQTDNGLDDFFEFLTRCQGNRMDEQRCELPEPATSKSGSTEDMLDMVERVQGARLEEQRSDLPADENGSVTSELNRWPSDCELSQLRSEGLAAVLQAQS